MKNFMVHKKFWLFLAMVWACNWTLAVSPTLAQVPGAPFALPGPPEKKDEQAECPATFGPIITDTAVPLEKGKFAVQPTFGLGFVTNNLTQSWRRVSAGGNFKTFGMNWKFTYGLIKNMEVFAVVPYLNNWANSVKEPGPNGERSARFGGLGDVNLTMKYQLLEE